MQKDKTIDEAAATHLGQSGSYAVRTTEFDPSLLVRMPRLEGREDWSIKFDNFVGVDVWRAYESTFLLENGIPISGTLKIVYNASSEYMVESKSLKLYLNSFDMCKMGVVTQTAIPAYVSQVKKDLSKLLGVEVDVGFFTEIHDISSRMIKLFPQHTLVDSYTGGEDFNDYESKEFHIKYEEKTYAEKYGLKGRYQPMMGYYSNLLRSRCRHTGQKDSGSIYLTMRADKKLLEESFLRQVVSVRELNEFHEFCAEKIYDSIFQDYKDNNVDIKDLLIACLYARRGGIDINPIRASSWDMIPEPLMSTEYLCEKTIIQ